MITEVFKEISIYSKLLILYISILNIISFTIMGVDKRKAIKKDYRVRESTLIILGFIGGSIGILIGMVTFKHKINKRKFNIGIPILYILNEITISIINNYINIKK